jgi:hypothetical protein
MPASDCGVQQNLRDLFGGDAVVERATHVYFEFNQSTKAASVQTLSMLRALRDSSSRSQAPALDRGCIR